MRIALVRVKDPDDSDVELSDEEILITQPVVLGRGSLLKCGEKKISRRHAYLDVEDNGVRITSVHQSPTFVIVNGSEQQLNVGTSALLSHGDKFGLMKTHFWYKVSISKAEPNDEENEVKDLNVVSLKSSAEVKEKIQREISTEVPVGEIVKNGTRQTTMEDVNIDTIKKCEAQDDLFSQTHMKNADMCKTTEEDASLKTDKSLEKTDSRDSCSYNGETASSSTLTLQEVQSAVSTRKRNLPSWLAKNEVTKDGGKQIGKDTLHSHGVSQNTHSSAAKRKRAGNSVNKDSIAVLQASTNTTVRDRLSTSPAVTALPAVQNDDVASNSKLNKQKNSTTPTKNKQDLSTKKAIASPIKVSSPKNRLGKVHNMSEEDSDGEATNEENQTRDQSTCNTKRHDYAKQESPPDRRHSPSKHRNISESEDDDELNGTINDTNNVSSNAPVSSTATGTSPAVTQKKVPRKTCQYGRNCYRKNPQHREDFAHDGDSDFNDNPSNNEDSDDDRPECEYGVKCYRKNTDHRRNFKHSRMPQPQRKAKRKARRQKQDEESASDDYDYDDPFLNDDSSDEYAPTESDTE